MKLRLGLLCVAILALFSCARQERARVDASTLAPCSTQTLARTGFPSITPLSAIVADGATDGQVPTYNGQKFVASTPATGPSSYAMHGQIHGTTSAATFSVEGDCAGTAIDGGTTLNCSHYSGYIQPSQISHDGGADGSFVGLGPGGMGFFTPASGGGGLSNNTFLLDPLIYFTSTNDPACGSGNYEVGDSLIFQKAGIVVTGIKTSWACPGTFTLTANLWRVYASCTLAASGSLVVTAPGTYVIPFTSAYTTVQADVGGVLATSIYAGSTNYSKYGIGSYQVPALPLVANGEVIWLNFRSYNSGPGCPQSTSNVGFYADPVLQ
jgi:hypothetical protein